MATIGVKQSEFGQRLRAIMARIDPEYEVTDRYYISRIEGRDCVKVHVSYLGNYDEPVIKYWHNTKKSVSGWTNKDAELLQLLAEIAEISDIGRWKTIALAAGNDMRYSKSFGCMMPISVWHEFDEE